MKNFIRHSRSTNLPLSSISHLKFLTIVAGFVFTSVPPVSALPPAEDTPEEILRTEIITEARSPLNGKPLTAAEYAALKAKIEAGPPLEPELSPRVRRVVNLLRIPKIH